MDNNNFDPREKGLEEMIKATCQTDGPSEALRARVNGMAASHDEKANRSFWRSRGAKAAAAFSLLLLVGWTTYKIIFNRPGEMAIQLIPADALMVVTLDTMPSPAQVPLFKRIDDALRTERVEQKLDEQLGEAFKELPKVSGQIRPYLQHSFALAVLDGAGGRDWEHSEAVVLLALKDPDAVRGIVAANGRRPVHGSSQIYRLDGQFYGSVVERYLVVSRKPAFIAKVQAVDDQGGPSVAGLPEYQQSRAELPEDANLMLFVSPSALGAASEEGKKFNVNPLRGTRWMAVAGTLRDKGIEFDFRWPMERAAMQGLSKYAAVKPIDPAAYNRLPAGPYGLAAFAQPGRLWDYAMDAISEDGRARAETEQGLAQFEKESGISITRDIVPALMGNVWLAVYPHDAAANDWLPDGLIVADDSNGANAAALFDRLRAAISRETGKNGEAVQFTRSEANGAVIWELDNKTRKELNEGVKGTVDSFSDDESAAAGGKRKGWDWTVAVAQVDRGLVIATSRQMLDRAIAAYHGQGLTLADDPAFKAMREMAVPGSQGVMMVNLASIMERLRGALEEFDTNGTATIAVDDVVKLFGTADAGMVVSGRYDGNEQVGRFFLPLDYERAIRVISGAQKAERKQKLDLDL